MKRNIITLAIIIIALLIISFLVEFLVFDFDFSSIKNNSNTNLSETSPSEEEPQKETETAIPDKTVSLSIIGDIMCHNTQYQDAYSNGTYDFSYVFSNITPYLSNADVTIGNLETTFAGSEKGYSSYPTFNTPEQLAQNLKDAGIDILTTANNHSLDTGFKGIESTLYYLDCAGIKHTGSSRTVEEQNTPLIYEVNGLKIAILAFTYGTNGIAVPSGKEFCINLIDNDLMTSQLNAAKEQNPDIILVAMHWGTEYENTPNQSQKDLADFLFQNGVDIIIGSHPHVSQELEVRNVTLADGSTKTGFVIYSMGNFMSGQTKANTKTSIILNLELTKHGDTSELTFDKISYEPIYTYTSKGSKGYKILNMLDEIQNYEETGTNIDKSTYETFISEVERLKSIYVK